MKCVVCQGMEYSRVSQAVRDSLKHSIVCCTRCHTVQLFPIPSADTLKEFYDTWRQCTNIAALPKLEDARIRECADTIRRADYVAKALPSGSMLLDIGSGYGFFLEEMKRRGFRPVGIEISAHARAVARRVTDAKIIDVDISKEAIHDTYDAITLFHVLEHIPNPVDFLVKIHPLLRTDGVLIIEVPNLDDLLVSSNDSYRAFYWQCAHILYLNKKTLAHLLQEAGFSAYTFDFVQRYGLSNFMHWMVMNEPQLTQPSFALGDGNYRWLERMYKDTLIQGERSDTLLVQINKGKAP